MEWGIHHDLGCGGRTFQPRTYPGPSWAEVEEMGQDERCVASKGVREKGLVARSSKDLPGTMASTWRGLKLGTELRVLSYEGKRPDPSATSWLGVW